MQSLVVNRLLGPLYGLMGKMSDRAKDVCFVISFLLLYLEIGLYKSSIIRPRYLVIFSLGCVFLGLMILFSMRGRVREVRFRKWFITCWLLFGAAQFISAFAAGCVDYLPDSLIILVAMPILYIVWTNTGFEKIFRLMFISTRMAFLIFIVLSMLFSPFCAHYSGVFTNPNGMVQFLLVPFCFFSYYALWGEERKDQISSTILLAICAAFMFYSNSRTGQISACLVFFAVAFLYLIKVRFKDARLIKRMVICVVLMVLLTWSLVFVFSFISSLGLPTLEDFGIVLDTAETELGTLEDVIDVSANKNALLGRTLDQISAGRIAIWRVFIQDMNLTGHVTGYKLFIPERDRYYTTAHNYAVQMAYDHGIPAGILALVIEFAAFFLALRNAFRNRFSFVSCLPLMMIGAFLFTSLLEALSVTFHYSFLLNYYFMLAPLMSLGFKEKEQLS